MDKILDALGLGWKPKTLGGKIMKGAQIITIPLFIIVVAYKPIGEERRQRAKEEKDRREELQMSKQLQEKHEAAVKKYQQ